MWAKNKPYSYGYTGIVTSASGKSFKVFDQWSGTTAQIRSQQNHNYLGGFLRPKT